MTLTRRIIPFLTVLALTACGGPAVLPNGTSTLHGRIAFDPTPAGAPGTVAEVILVDTADPDVRSPLGTARMDHPEDTPIPFTLVYNVHSVQAGHTYGLCARVKDAAGSVTWASDRVTPVTLPSDDRYTNLVIRDEDDWADCPEWDH